MNIYISLPISGYDLGERAKRCEFVKAKIEKLGHTPISPLDITPIIPTHATEKQRYAYFMGEDIKCILSDVDAILFDQDWKNSKGCRAEDAIAKIYGIERFYLISDIPSIEK